MGRVSARAKDITPPCLLNHQAYDGIQWSMPIALPTTRRLIGYRKKPGNFAGVGTGFWKWSLVTETSLIHMHVCHVFHLRFHQNGMDEGSFAIENEQRSYKDLLIFQCYESTYQHGQAD